MKQLCLLALTFLVPLSVQAESPVVQSAAPAPEIDSLFQRTDGWIGADGAYSVSIAPAKSIWLFSDTWIGKVRDGRRTDATIVNNTIGVQASPTERLSYTIAQGSDGKPGALFVPPDHRGWFWLQAGVSNKGRLSIFLNQVEKTDDKSVFGFRSVGLWLANVTITDQSPDRWHVEMTKLSNVEFTSNRLLTWGAAVLQVGDDLYVYGTDERIGNGFPARSMVVARVPVASVEKISTWRYFRDGEWHDDFGQPTHVVEGMASEYSVTAYGKRFLAVYTENGLSPRILGRLADNPWGPWSAPTLLYQCPEMGRDKKLFCYSAKAHPSLSAGRDVVISYVVNSFDFWQVAREANLYWPRFVRVTLAHEE